MMPTYIDGFFTVQAGKAWDHKGPKSQNHVSLEIQGVALIIKKSFGGWDRGKYCYSSINKKDALHAA